MNAKMESHLEKNGKLLCLLDIYMLNTFDFSSRHNHHYRYTSVYSICRGHDCKPLGLKVLDTREEETKIVDFPLITFIKPNIIEYFYNGDKFKILLVRLNQGMFKSSEEKNSIFQKLLSNEIETGNKNDKKTKKPKPKIETEEKTGEKENAVEEKSQKEMQKEQLLKVLHLSLS